MANTYLSRTTSSAGNQLKHTISFWFKRSNISSNQTMFSASGDNSHANKRLYIFFSSGDFLYVKQYNGSATDYELITNRAFRDTNAWYHCVIQYDAANSTANNRQRIWINGVEETSFSVRTNPSTSTNSYLGGNGLNVYVGQDTNVASRFFDGSISHLHYCDGYAYTASDFGSTDSTTGEWKINTSPSVTYGTNGFFILKDGNSVTDQSGNSNNFTVAGGTLTNTEDNPSNIFATLNGVKPGIDVTLSNGNTTMVSGTASTRTPTQTTLGMASGKYYAEFKVTNSANAIMGVVSSQDNSDVSRGTKYYTGYSALGWGYNGVGGMIVNDGSSVGGTWSTFSVGDIIGVAINLDDLQGGLNKLYFSKNGVWQNSADPSNYSSTTGVVGITAPSNTDEGFYYFSVGDRSGSDSSGAECNFGNGYFGTTAVSSAGTNASGIGIFEYDVPTGFTALSTKGLNE